MIWGQFLRKASSVQYGLAIQAIYLVPRLIIFNFLDIFWYIKWQHRQVCKRAQTRQPRQRRNKSSRKEMVSDPSCQEAADPSALWIGLGFDLCLDSISIAYRTSKRVFKCSSALNLAKQISCGIIHCLASQVGKAHWSHHCPCHP